MNMASISFSKTIETLSGSALYPKLSDKAAPSFYLVKVGSERFVGSPRINLNFAADVSVAGGARVSAFARHVPDQGGEEEDREKVNDYGFELFQHDSLSIAQVQRVM